MYKTLNKISNDLNVTMNELLSFTKNQLKNKYNINNNLKFNVIKEFMFCMEGQLASNLNKLMIDYILNYLLLF